jgi:hypothetical protein
VGRIATALVVGLVAVVLGAAVVDSLRRGEDGEESRPEEAARALAADAESRAAIANRLRHEGIAGRLLYTDERCTLRAVDLPDLVPAATPGNRGLGCGFSASPDGERVATPGAAWSPDSRRVAVCRGTSVVVSVASERAPEVARHRGCTPAWRPDGELTVVRRGEVFETSGRAVVRRPAIEAAARAHPVAPDRPGLRVVYEIVDVAWLDANRAAVLLRLGFTSAGRRLEPQPQVVLFEDARMGGSEAAVGESWTRLDARSGFVAVRPGRLLDSTARTVYPLIGTARSGANAVAVSPDGRWLAAASRGRITLLSIPALRAGRFRSVTLPIAARDLAWR